MEKDKCVVHVIGPKEVKLKDVLGPCDLYDGLTALNMENAWQYSKVYKNQVDIKTRDPNQVWIDWSRAGWNNQKAVRWPMGQDAIPLYSYWEGKKLDYVEARKKIYCPLYAKSVVETKGFQQLKQLYETQQHIYLWDFDGYDYIKLNKPLDYVLNDPTKKMGHAFVLAMLLTDNCAWIQ